MTEFIVFLLLTGVAGGVLVFMTRFYGAADTSEREIQVRASKPPEPRSGSDRRSGRDRRQMVRYEPGPGPRRAGSRRRSYEGLLRRIDELNAGPPRDTSRSRPPYPD